MEPQLDELDDGWTDEDDAAFDAAWDEEADAPIEPPAPGEPPRPKKPRPKRASREVREQRSRAYEQKKAEARAEKARQAARPGSPKAAMMTPSKDERSVARSNASTAVAPIASIASSTIRGEPCAAVAPSIVTPSGAASRAMRTMVSVVARLVFGLTRRRRRGEVIGAV